MYLGSTESVTSQLERLLGQGGLGGSNQYLNQFMQMLMGKMGGVTTPAIPQEVMSELDAEMQRNTQYGTGVINEQLRKSMGDLTAMAGTAGTLGSTGQGAAAGRIQAGGVNAIAELLNSLMSQKQNTLNSLREALLGAETQRLGIGGSVFPGVTGTAVQGYGIAGELAAQREAQQAQMWQSILGSLGSIGTAAGTWKWGK